MISYLLIGTTSASAHLPVFDEVTAVGDDSVFPDGCAKLLFLGEQVQGGILHKLLSISAVVLRPPGQPRFIFGSEVASMGQGLGAISKT